MTKYMFECRYCGHTWKSKYYTEPSKVYFRCPRCDDSSIEIKEYQDVDYYGEKKLNDTKTKLHSD